MSAPDRDVVRLVVAGRVQGVGYRAWLAAEADRRGLSGWVRNRRDGAVEALLSGSAADLAAMLAACGRGPVMAAVESLATHPASEPAEAGFRVLPTE